MDWTEIYRDAVTGRDIVLVRADPPEGVIDLATVAPSFMEPGQERQWGKPCRIIPCPGSYFPAHDEQCEMAWIWEKDADFGTWTDCACEPRARVARDELTEDL